MFSSSSYVVYGEVYWIFFSSSSFLSFERNSIREKYEARRFEGLCELLIIIQSRVYGYKCKSGMKIVFAIYKAIFFFKFETLFLKVE